MLRILTLCGILLGGILSPVGAATYYIDSVAGNDAAAGTSPATAWKNLSAFNQKEYAAENPVVAGDSLLLKYGSVWADSLYVRFNHTTIDAYGDSTLGKPIIDGSDSLTTYAGGTGNVYTATLDGMPKDELPIIYINSVRALPQAGSAAAVDAEGEWFWTAATNTLTFCTDTPAAVRIPKRQWGVATKYQTPTPATGLAIRNVAVTRTHLQGIKLNLGCDSSRVEYCTVYNNSGYDYNDANAIDVDASYCTISHCVVRNSGANAIDITSEPGYNTVEYCHVSNSAHHAFDTKDGAGHRFVFNIAIDDPDFVAPARTVENSGNHFYIGYNNTSTDYVSANTYVYGNIAAYCYKGNGFQVTGDADNMTTGVRLYHNVAYDNDGHQLLLTGWTGTVDAKNNILVVARGISTQRTLTVNDTTNKTVDYNIHWRSDGGTIAQLQSGSLLTTLAGIRAYGRETHGKQQDPLLDTTTFAVPANSPAANTGYRWVEGNVWWVPATCGRYQLPVLRRYKLF